MRILWLARRDLRSRVAGGAERTIREIGRRLVQRGHDFELITGGWAKPSERVPVPEFQVTWAPGIVAPQVLALASSHVGLRPQVIVDDLAHIVPWLTPITTSIPGVAFFRHWHARTLGGMVKPVTRELLELIERAYPIFYRSWPFVTESRSSQSDLEQLGIPNSQVHRIPPGVDMTLFKPQTRSLTPQIVYFGGLKKYKRPDHAIEAFYRMTTLGFKGRMVVVGEGPVLEHVRALTVARGLSGKVDFVGRLGESALSDLVAQSWLNLHCSVSEGWCYSVSEACAAGVPTAAYNVPGLTDSVLDGKTGRLVRDGDCDALARASLEMLASVEDWSDRCRIYGRSRSWNECTDEWEVLLESLAENG